MEDERQEERRVAPSTGAAAFEHLTGPCHGTVTWLGPSTSDISLGPDRFIRISEAHPDEPQEDVIVQLQLAENTDFWSVDAHLAAAGLIAPLASRGIVGQTTLSTIVYDAETTHGGSGGPVLDVNSSVIAVNFAGVGDFSGSNLGVLVAKVRTLLEDAGFR